MDFIKAVSIIGRDLEEAIALLDQLSAEGGSNIAEIELARLRVRSAAELLRLLPGLNGTRAAGSVKETGKEEPVKHAAGPVVTEVQAAQAAEPVVMEVQAAQTAEPVATAVSAAQAPEPVATAVSAAQAPEPVATDITPAKAAGTQKAQDPHKTILADRFAASGTVGEKISSGKQEGAISSVMHNKPIADIGGAIGMNDKFYFIRELFSGDAIAYHDTIRRLNTAASLGEAMRILDESTVMGSDPYAQSSFVDVVRRKFNIHV